MLRVSILYCRAFTIVALAFSLVVPAQGGGPVFWEVSKQDDILRGDAGGVSISESGVITLAPAFDLVFDTKEAYIWSSAADAAGNIYLGTGHEGRIFKVEPNGGGKLIFDSPELDVTALATDSRGNLYAGTGPDGKIYKIAPDGKDSVFHDPEDKYIWSLVFDDRTSTLYAGTGDKGVIYRIDASGKATVLTDTNENNIVCLKLDKDGSLIAGTDPNGLVLRVSPQGRVFALFDSPAQEIHNLALAPDGAILATGVNPDSGQRASGVGVSSTSSLSRQGTITISTSDEETQEGGQAVDLSGLASAGQLRGAGRADGARSALFKILPDGGSEVLWSSTVAVGFALQLTDDGRALIGTNNKGRIYSVSRDRSYTLLVQSPEDQTSTLLEARGETFAASSNMGRLYRIGRSPVAEGSYLSTVHDTKFAGQWGVITWRGAGNIEIQTRTGNTDSPDATWSDFSPAYRKATGDQITSPRARFIQWRAVLRRSQSASTSRAAYNGQQARLHSVVVAYLPRNQSPEVSSVSVLPPGVALQEMPIPVDPSIASSGLDPQIFGAVGSVPPRRFFQKGARTLTWQASDPNGDTLSFQLFYRTLGDSQWHLLADNLSQTYYTIDGSRLPDGEYEFRVQASDSPSNPSALALIHDQITDAVQIDNTPPEVIAREPSINGRRVSIRFDARDSTSRVIRGEYSVNGGPWQLIFPTDGVADSGEESFTVEVTFDRDGEHIIAFRCSDSSSNVGTAKVTVRVR